MIYEGAPHSFFDRKYEEFAAASGRRLATGARVHREPLIRAALAAAVIAALAFASAAAAGNPGAKTVTGWIDALAMDGPNVAYSAENPLTLPANVVVWNVLSTGSAKLVKRPEGRHALWRRRVERATGHGSRAHRVASRVDP